MINFYSICNIELDMSHLREDIEILTSDIITKNHDYGNVLHIIKKEPRLACWYAREIMKSRWIEAEPYIIEHGIVAYIYAKYVIRGRWLEAEPIMRKFGPYWGMYCQEFGI